MGWIALDQTNKIRVEFQIELPSEYAEEVAEYRKQVKAHIREDYF